MELQQKMRIVQEMVPGKQVTIAHIIANHAGEGDGTLRCPEAVVVNKADFINFESVKSFLGMK